jgi:hypothetical protein
MSSPFPTPAGDRRAGAFLGRDDLDRSRRAALPEAQQGTAAAVVNTAAQVGTALGVAVLLTIASVIEGDTASSGRGYTVAFLAAAVLAGAVAAASMLNPPQSPKRVARSAPDPVPTKRKRLSRRLRPHILHNVVAETTYLNSVIGKEQKPCRHTFSGTGWISSNGWPALS